MEEIQNDEKSNSGNDSARPWQSYNTVYTNAKAGMEGVDKEKVQRVVYEMSKGSKYFEHEEKKEAYMKHKIESFRAQLAKLTDSDLSHHRKIADRKIAGLEATRDLSRIWLHVDMDAFYAAVETLSNPSLKGKPMAVGSMSMLSTANYEVAEELRESVHKETGLTCSAGVAPNRLLAKVCSDINKPNGQFVLPNERVAVVTFISSLPIRKIGGIGKVTENILKGVLGITTCEEMLQKSSFICALFSHASADFFLSVSLGIGRTDTPQASQRKSMSTERTFSPTGDKASIFQKLVDLSENLSSDLKKEGIRGRTLTLKLKTSSFEVRTRAVTLSYNTCSSEDILKQAKKLLKAELPVSLRLMGLRMSNFGEGREGVAADPKQKTLSNFLGADDASRRGLGAQVQLESTICDDALAIIDTESSLCGDIHEPSESIDFADTYQIHDSEHTGTRHFHSESETREAFNLQIDNLNEKVCHHDTVGAAADLLPTGTGRLVERDSSSGLCEESSFDQHKRDCSNGEAGSSLNPRDTICWLNDYQCSVCGAELPPSFIEERQEHFDFHLAERLQDEESINRNRLVKPPNLRFAEKGDMSNRKKKKQKRSSPSEGKHIPIDAFFAKTSQNF
ncbi:DNA polymerase kappa isoform X2 [Salvia hispanica]|uniref:DNA polymerase kappa isoform X2 n=1 Tax=Salvia hispanica TaxID=49212 RepID=UPI00200991F5|nr:DNA polymerase kappa isoform X2 [Salvia hispanica]